MCAGADPGEVKWVNFHPPFSEPLFNHADAQTSNTSTRLWFYYIITKIHPPFQNPGFAPGVVAESIKIIGDINVNTNIGFVIQYCNE